MMANDVLLIFFEVFLFHLKSRVIDLFLSGKLCQWSQNRSFHMFSSKHMRNDDSLSRPKLPNVNVMYVHNPIDVFAFFAQGFHLKASRHWLHDDQVAIFGDWDGGSYCNDCKNISGDGIEEMPVVPLSHFCPIVWAQKIDEERCDQNTNALNDIGWIKYELHKAWRIAACIPILSCVSCS